MGIGGGFDGVSSLSVVGEVGLVAESPMEEAVWHWFFNKHNLFPTSMTNIIIFTIF